MRVARRRAFRGQGHPALPCGVLAWHAHVRGATHPQEDLRARLPGARPLKHLATRSRHLTLVSWWKPAAPALGALNFFGCPVHKDLAGFLQQMRLGDRPLCEGAFQSSLDRDTCKGMHIRCSECYSLSIPVPPCLCRQRMG